MLLEKYLAHKVFMQQYMYTLCTTGAAQRWVGGCLVNDTWRDYWYFCVVMNFFLFSVLLTIITRVKFLSKPTNCSLPCSENVWN